MNGIVAKVENNEYLIDCWYTKGRGIIVHTVILEGRTENSHTFDPMAGMSETINPIARANAKKLELAKAFIETKKERLAIAYSDGRKSYKELVKEFSKELV